MKSNRAGVFIDQPSHYSSFKPNPLPPDPPIQFDSEMLKLLSDADRKLGRLDGITEIIPNPDLFVAMYVRKEALLSSQIEGTQASLSDLLGADSDPDKKEDIEEVVNYVHAMNYGLRRLESLPLSLRLLREIHQELLRNGRGSKRNPGEFRTSQNWIGPPGCTLQTAAFVPPSVPDMRIALADLELFLYSNDDIPELIKIALIHAQFETIHPFLDGNGRVGRLLITFWLCNKGILSKPLLYLSYYFKQNRLEYYDRLMSVRKDGAWEEWIKFFLKGIASISDEATATAKEIIDLKNQLQLLLVKNNNVNYSHLLDILFYHPFVTKADAADLLKVSYPTASKVVDDFHSLHILKDITPSQSRNKKYAFEKYMNILGRGTDD